MNQKFSIGEEVWIVQIGEKPFKIDPWQKATVKKVVYGAPENEPQKEQFYYQTEQNFIPDNWLWREKELRKINPDTDKKCEEWFDWKILCKSNEKLTQ